MTVEAALVLPLFIFFMCNILYVFDMIRLQSSMICALHEAGCELSEYAYWYRYGDDDLQEILEGSSALNASSESSGGLGSYAISLMLSETWVRNRVSDYLGSEYLDHTCLEGGDGGISYMESSILAGDDIISLVADYRVKPFIPILAPESFSQQSRFYGHGWVGYTIGDESGTDQETESEEMVYITVTGRVYHVDRGCTYLNPSIRAVDAGSVRTLRNKEGAKYYQCEICRAARKGTLYITNEGNRYHNSRTCSGLKRTVLEVPLKSVEGRMPPCSKCGG